MRVNVFMCALRDKTRLTSFVTCSSGSNYTGCMLQSGEQWRPAGGCFGGIGAGQVCSNRGQMTPLSPVQFGTLDDDFNSKTWIYADYGRVVVNPPKQLSGGYIPAIPYLQNGFVLLQIALQEVRTCPAA